MYTVGEIEERIKKQLAIVCVWGLLICPVEGLTAQTTTTAPVVIADTEVHDLASLEIGQDFRISVALPAGYASGDVSYPVLYVLDADIAFGMAVEYARLLAFGAEVQEVILVGIGYGASDLQVWGRLRTRDFTPTSGARNPSVMSIGLDSAATPGGAREFLTFIRNDVQPFIRARYRTVPEQNGVFGDSFGGLFSLYTLFHAPDTFSEYIIGSPSIWWDGRVTLQYEEQYAARHSDLDASIFMAVGALEETGDDSISVAAGMVSNIDALARQLRARNYSSFEIETHVFDGETHLSVVMSNFGWGIRRLYPPKTARP